MPVPRVLHQIWMQGADKIPARYDGPRASWAETHSHWTRLIWDEASMASLARGTIWETAIALCPKMIQRCDVYRCMLLQQRGGVYADMDMYALQPLDSLLGDDRIQVGNTTFEHVPLLKWTNRINNALIVSPQGHPFWSEVLLPTLMRRLYTRHLLDNIHVYHIMRTAGPAMWTAAVDGAPAEWVYAHPCNAFYSTSVKKGFRGFLGPEERAELKGALVYHAQDTTWLGWEAKILNFFITLGHNLGKHNMVLPFWLLVVLTVWMLVRSRRLR